MAETLKFLAESPDEISLTLHRNAEFLWSNLQAAFEAMTRVGVSFKKFADHIAVCRWSDYAIRGHVRNDQETENAVRVTVERN